MGVSEIRKLGRDILDRVQKMSPLFHKKKRGAQVEPGPEEMETEQSLKSNLSHYRKDTAYLQEKQQALFNGEDVLDWYDFLIHTQLCTMNYNPLEISAEERFDHVVRMMQNLKIPQNLKKSTKEIIPFIYDVFCLMRSNPYHNFTHITDVTQYLYTLLLATHLAKRLDPIELTACFFSVLCHDLDHPGYTNAYQNNENTAISQRYNGKSPNENHHYHCFQLLVKRHNLLANVQDEASKKRFFDVVHSLILATDMSKHTELVKRIKDNLSDSESYNPLSTHEGVDLTLSIALKCADISNQARPWRVANRWNDYVYREFYAEGDNDRQAGRKVPPLFDRESNDIPKSSVGFIGFVVAPLFEVFLAIMKRIADTNTVVDSSAVEECLFFLNQNKSRYQKLLDGEHVSPDEIEQELLAFTSQDLRNEGHAQTNLTNNQDSLPGINANNVHGLAEMFSLRWLQKHLSSITSEQLFELSNLSSQSNDNLTTHASVQHNHPEKSPIQIDEENKIAAKIAAEQVTSTKSLHEHRDSICSSATILLSSISDEDDQEHNPPP